MSNIIYILIVLNLSICSQVQQEWVRRYNGLANSSDIGRAMVIDNSGNLYVTGASIVNSGSSWDVYTIKYNSSGVQQWNARYAGSGNIEDDGKAIAVDQFGNVYVTGSVNGHTNNEDFITIKYSSSGVQQWAVTYNGPDNYSDEAYSIAVDDSGNVYVTGRTVSNGRYDYCTIKYSPSGSEQWAARFDGPLHLNDQPFQLRIDAQNNVYVTGGIDELSSDTKNIATVKYNSSGSLQWSAIYNGTANNSDEGRSLAVDNSGNVYVTGQSKGNGSDFDVVTIKYNQDGSQIWAVNYSGPGNYIDRGNSIGISLQGDIYVSGWSHGIGTSADLVTLKYSPSGVQQWVQRYNGPGNDIEYTSPPNSLAIDISGNTYITGWSKGINSDYDYCTIKYSPSGTQQWVQRYNGPGNNADYGIMVAVDSFNNIYTFGISRDSINYDDYCLIKYSLLVAIKQVNTEIPSDYSLSQNYPNPFNPVTKIKFSIPLSRGVSAGRGVLLIIYDILGSEVATLVNEELKPGTYEVEFDGSNYSSGVYYYKLIVGDASLLKAGSSGFTETKKMILIK